MLRPFAAVCEGILWEVRKLTPFRTVSFFDLVLHHSVCRYGYTPQVSLQLAQVDLNNCITDKKQGPEFIEEGEPHQKMVAQIRIPEERHSYIVSPIE